MAGLGLLDEGIKLPGFRIRGDLFVPKFLTIFLQPVGYRMNLFRVEPGDGGFDVFYRAHNGLTLPRLNREVKTGERISLYCERHLGPSH